MTSPYVSRPSKPRVSGSSPLGRASTRKLSLESRVRLLSGPPTKQGCMPWLGYVQPDGYGALSVNGRRKSAHRTAFELAHGPVASGLMVRHVCNNRRCVNVRHLRLGTAADNQRDKVIAGRQARGEENGRAKLTEDDARLIYYRLTTGARVTDLAREFGITRRAVRFIREGKNWKHIHSKPRQALMALIEGM
jgi:hypothetical protein